MWSVVSMTASLALSSNLIDLVSRRALLGEWSTTADYWTPPPTPTSAGFWLQEASGTESPI